MSSNTAGTLNPQNTLKLEGTSAQQPAQSQLSGLEEDDEFEEFAVQGMILCVLCGRGINSMN